MKPDPIHIAAHTVRLLLIAAAAMPGATAFAKLPPPTEEAKSIATENAAKSAWAEIDKGVRK